MSYQKCYLQKLHLTISSIDGEEKEQGEKVECAIIFGASSTGLCPFEVMLGDLASNDMAKVSLSPQECKPFLGHHYGAVTTALKLPFLPPVLRFAVMVTSIEKADQREVVSAIAKVAESHGCGGSCDCGCS